MPPVADWSRRSPRGPCTITSHNLWIPVSFHRTPVIALVMFSLRSQSCRSHDPSVTIYYLLLRSVTYQLPKTEDFSRTVMSREAFRRQGGNYTVTCRLSLTRSCPILSAFHSSFRLSLVPMEFTRVVFSSCLAYRFSITSR